MKLKLFNSSETFESPENKEIVRNKSQVKHWESHSRCLNREKKQIILISLLGEAHLLFSTWLLTNYFGLFFLHFLFFTLCWLLTSSSPLHSSGQSTVSSRRVQRIVSSPFQIYPSLMRWQWWPWLIYHFVSSDLSEKPLQDALARQ